MGISGLYRRLRLRFTATLNADISLKGVTKFTNTNFTLITKCGCNSYTKYRQIFSQFTAMDYIRIISDDWNEMIRDIKYDWFRNKNEFADL